MYKELYFFVNNLLIFYLQIDEQSVIICSTSFSSKNIFDISLFTLSFKFPSSSTCCRKMTIISLILLYNIYCI